MTFVGIGFERAKLLVSKQTPAGGRCFSAVVPASTQQLKKKDKCRYQQFQWKLCFVASSNGR